MVTVFDLQGIQASLHSGGGGGTAPETAGVTTGSIRPTRLGAVVVLRGGRDPLGLEVQGVEDIREYEATPEGGVAPGGESPGADPSAAPAEGRLWAGKVRDAGGEIGVLDVLAVAEFADALAREAVEPVLIDDPGPPHGPQDGPATGPGTGAPREQP